MSQVLTLFTTPVIYLAFDRLAGRRAAPLASRRRESRREPLRAVHSRTRSATTLLTFGIALAGIVAYCPAAGVAAAAGRFPDHRGAGDLAGRQSGDGGDQRRHTSRASPRPDCRRLRNDFDEHARARRASSCNSVSTATSTAPRATCRRRSTPRAPTCRRACAPIRRTGKSTRRMRRCWSSP